MKTKLLKLFSLRATMLVALVCAAFTGTRADDEVFYTLEPEAGSNDAYASNCDVAINGITWNVTGNSKMIPWRIGGKNLSSGVDRAVYSKTTIDETITKVDLTVGEASSITVNSLKLIVASDASFNTIIDQVSKTFTANSKITFTPSTGKEWKNAYYKFLFNVTVSGSSNKFVQFSKAEFYRAVDSRIEIAEISGITPTSLLPDDDGTFGVTAAYADGTSASDATITWATSDDTVVDVDLTGEYLAFAEGTADITVTITPNNSTDYKEVYKKFTVTVAKGDAELSFDQTSFVVSTDASFTPPTLNNPHGVNVTYTISENTNVAEITSAGVVTIGNAAGNVTVTATSNSAKYEGTASYTIEVTEAAINTVSFNVNGTSYPSTDVAEGNAIPFPTVPTTIGGIKFLGWTTTAIVGTASTKPAVLIQTATMGDSDITYYAVYGISNEIIDVLTRETTGRDVSSYADWSDKTASSDAVYAGQSAGGNNSIQLRSDNNNSGVITTNSGGKVKKVVVNWYSSTSTGRTLNVYGKQSAYSDATDLYDTKKQGSLLGTIVKGTSTELTINGDYTFIGLRSASGAMYLSSVSITWVDESITESYCTTINPVEVTVSSLSYATFASDIALDFTGKSVAAYIAETKGDGTGVTFKQINKVPAGTGVLLYADGGATDVEIPALVGDAEDVSTNVFVRGEGANVATEVGDNYNFILNNGGSGFGFYRANNQMVASDKAYISIPKSESASVKGFIALPGFGDETAISAVKAAAENGVIFNLAGQRVNKAQKGLCIVNGQKVVK